MTALYHYTCSHSVAGIERSGIVLPGLDELAWFTDLDVPDRRSLGLTSYLLKCDRTRFRFTATAGGASSLVPWSDVRNDRAAALLEIPGTRPDRWWVSSYPVRVIRRADLAKIHEGEA